MRAAPLLLILALAVALPARAATFVPGPIDCSSPDGHCYQRVAIQGNPRQFYNYADVAAYAAAQRLGDRLGHLLTIETEAEYQWPSTPWGGYLGAKGSGADYVWNVGPSYGQTVQFFGAFAPAPQPGTEAYCAPFERLCDVGGDYLAVGPRAQIPPFVTGCPCDLQFVIEYETDTGPPRAHLLFPNGTEILYTGRSYLVMYSAVDYFGTLTTIDLQLSRSGPDGPFEDVVTGLANTGQYLWTPTEPYCEDQAFLRVIAHDAAGNTGADMSDRGFSIAPVVAARTSSWGRVKALFR